MPSRRLLLLVLLSCLGPVALPAPGGAEVYLSRKEAIAEAFPEAERVEERTVILDDAQARAVESLARTPLESRLVTIYEGRADGGVTGYAFIDVHTVRTLPEAFLVVVSPEGEVAQLRLLAFYEPPEYAPAEGWLAQFDQRRLDDRLRLGGEIHGIAGATLSSRAVTGGVRRALALFEVVVQGRTDAGSGDLAEHGAGLPPGGR
ncbi:MAG: FMN-binding protein [Myxococcota bacterium]|nr:FMN-binding protein [Myxococcota bacterium]